MWFFKKEKEKPPEITWEEQCKKFLKDKKCYFCNSKNVLIYYHNFTYVLGHSNSGFTNGKTTYYPLLCGDCGKLSINKDKENEIS